MLTTIIRHKKEKRKKCSLTPLETNEQFVFHKAIDNFTFDASGFVVLSVDAPLISHLDKNKPLLLLDSTWNLLSSLEKRLTGDIQKRSLPPSIKTAYPRKSKMFEDPLNQLATIEALWAALFLMGKNPSKDLLNSYLWKDEFFKINKEIFKI